jgi:glycosyltransferase involved in cell wall biosynthesis
VIEFIHPELRNYRLELFDKLHMRYSVKFIFTGYRELKGYDPTGIPESWNYEKTQIISSQPLKIFNTSFLGWFRFIRSLLRDNYEVILSSPAENYYSFISLIASKLRSKKIIFWGEFWYWPSKKRILRLYYYIFTRWILSKSDAIIAQGKNQYAFYRDILKSDVAVFYAPNYVIRKKETDATKLLATLALKDPKILGKKIILYLSRIIINKGLDYLIRAFKILEGKFDDVYLLIGGGGEFEAYCKKLAENLSIKNIMFAGYVDSSDTEFYFNACDVFVLPTVLIDDLPDASGYVVFEAMSVGRPVVVSDAVGARELVKDGVNGFVVKQKNVEELANALSKILADEMLQERMGNESKKIFEENISLEKQFEVFKTAIDFVRRKK